jgi:pimeloyl-ACP methyl ester carboxylesterase
VTGPCVLVGFSIGGLVARLYESQNPDKTAGMVIVDHAFVDIQSTSAPAAQPPVRTNGVDAPPVLISATPIVLNLEDDRNFTKLSERDKELHRWALSIHSFRPTPEMAEECFSEVENAIRGRSLPLGNLPLIVGSTLNDSPSYRELQGQLLQLSRNSAQAIAPTQHAHGHNRSAGGCGPSNRDGRYCRTRSPNQP